jgi:hypothetical protein
MIQGSIIVYSRCAEAPNTQDSHLTYTVVRCDVAQCLTGQTKKNWATMASWGDFPRISMRIAVMFPFLKMSRDHVGSRLSPLNFCEFQMEFDLSFQGRP